MNDNTPAASGAAPALPKADGRQCLNGVWMDAFTAEQMTLFGNQQFNAGREFESERLAALASREASPAPLTDDEKANPYTSESPAYASWREGWCTCKRGLARSAHQRSAYYDGYTAALASPQVAPAPTINGEPATAQSLLAAMIDIYDDGQNNPPEHRCYVEDAWPEILSDARTFLAAPVQVAPAVPEALYGVGNDQINWPLVGALIEAHMTVSRYHSPGTSNWGAWLYKSIVKAAREAAPAPVAPQDDARDAADPLQGAADWLKEALTPCTPYDIGGRLLIGYNRALRLFHATPAAKPTEPTLPTQGEQSHD